MGLISTSKDKVEEESDEEDDGEYICDDCDFRYSFTLFIYISIRIKGISV